MRQDKKSTVVLKYYHPSAVYRDGELFCSECGTELDRSITSEKPCSVPTASVLIYGDYEIAVSVWNCRASLVAYRTNQKRELFYASISVDPEIEDELYNLILDSIYRAGGAVNISGWYPFSAELLEFVRENLEKGKIRILEK